MGLARRRQNASGNGRESCLSNGHASEEELGRGARGGTEA